MNAILVLTFVAIAIFIGLLLILVIKELFCSK